MHFIDALIERGCEIEITGVQEDFESRVIFHCDRQVEHHVGRAG